MNKKDRRRRRVPIVAGGMALMIVCLILIGVMMDKNVQVPFDSNSVEFETEGETITSVSIGGRFPYQSIVPNPVEKHVTEEGDVTEIYEIEGEFSLNLQVRLKLDIKTSEKGIYTYILKFADRDVTIANGKVVEQEP